MGPKAGTLGALLLAAALGLVSGCAGKQGAPAQAPQPYANIKDPLLLMGSAMDDHVHGDWAFSNLAVERCLQVIHARPQVKLGEETGSLLLAEHLRSHGGDAHELVFLHTLGMLNYAMLGQVESGLVEARRSDELQGWLKREGKAASDDPLGRIIAAKLYEIDGQPDDAYIDLNKAYQAYDEAGAEVPSFLWQDLQRLAKQSGRTDDYNALAKRFGKAEPRPQGSAELWVLVYSGRVVLSGGRAGSVFPIQEGTVTSGSRVAELEAAYDLEPKVRQESKGRRLGEGVRNASRLAVRSALFVSLAVLSQGNMPADSFKLFDGAVQTDDRHWSNLPARVHAARLWLKPGVHPLVLEGVIDGQTYGLTSTARVQMNKIALVQASLKDGEALAFRSTVAQP